MPKAKSAPRPNGDVGYGKPPVGSRFKKGVSGNPGGRKKGSSNVKTDFEEVMNRPLEINDNGKKQILTVQQAMIVRLVQSAIKGDVRAITLCLDRVERYEATSSGAVEELSEEDGALIERQLQRLVAAAERKQKKSSKARSAKPEVGEGNDD